jgi:hypothetical protein
MKPLWFTVAILATALAMALAAFPSLAEEESSPPASEPAKQSTPLNDIAPEKESPVVLSPKHHQDVESSDEPRRLGWGLSFLMTTPLLTENQWDYRFKAWGFLGLVSFPISQIHHRLYLHGETGFGAMLSLVEETTTSFGYNHTYFDIPIRLRLLYPLNDKGVSGEVYVGAVLRLFEFNNDPNLSGGPLFNVSSGAFQPDFAVGLVYPFARNFRARLLAGYVYLSLGMEIVFD